MINDVIYRCNSIIELADDLQSKVDEQRNEASVAALKKVLADVEVAVSALVDAFEHLD